MPGADASGRLLLGLPPGACASGLALLGSVPGAAGPFGSLPPEAQATRRKTSGWPAQAGCADAMTDWNSSRCSSTTPP
jgi:hypothetical protein